MPASRRASAMSALLALLLVLLGSTPAAAGTDSTVPPSQGPATTENPAGTEPPASTEAPPPQTDPDATTTTGDDTDSPDSGDAGSVALIVVIGIGLAALIGVIAGRKSSDGVAQSMAAPSSPSPQRELLANVRWLHDQLSTQVMSGSSEAAAQQWAADRSRIQAMAVAALRFSSGAGGAAWQRLSTAISDTVSALDFVTAVRVDARADSTQVSHANAAVAESRALLLRSAEVASSTLV